MWIQRIAVCISLVLLTNRPSWAEKIDFQKQIAPIFERSCIRCHLPGNAKGDVILQDRKGLMESGFVHVGDSKASDLIAIISPRANGQKARMPNEGKSLRPEEISLIRQWIDEGADWPESIKLTEKSKAGKDWWALQPIQNPIPPQIETPLESWTKNPIDQFILQSLYKNQLKPNPIAAPHILIRRLCYDLTGLPATMDMIERFEKNPSEANYLAIVNELLASPHYGERWGRHWLDVVRFGESNGFERNITIDNLWPFRDYIIQSFNEDKPFDQLVREHLIGDLIAPGDPRIAVGTAFLVCGPYDNVGNQDAVQAAIIRANTLDEMIRATGETFLGVTIGCARCHNHKFDPITAEDYYQLYATFAGVHHGNRKITSPEQTKANQEKIEQLKRRLDEIRRSLGSVNSDPKKQQEYQKELTDAQQQIQRLQQQPPTWWVGDIKPANGPFHIFLGGEPQKKGSKIDYQSLSFASTFKNQYKLPESATESDRRRAFTHWLLSKENPLTARVWANRIWHYHFGTGIVNTPSDFGYMGGQPSHPDLLDWLSQQLFQHEWKLKPIHRLIVTSQTYRQSSQSHADGLAKDKDARLLWRFPPRRLSGEEVRDSMLLHAGKLNKQMGGPGFRLYQYIQDNVATYVPLDRPGNETYRRAVYHQNARASRVDVLTDFDCPDPAFANPRRASTVTPLQALTLFNHPFTLDMANYLAERIQAGTPNTKKQIEKIYFQVYGRTVTEQELQQATQFVQKNSLRAFCRAILNSNEFLYLD